MLITQGCNVTAEFRIATPRAWSNQGSEKWSHSIDGGVEKGRSQPVQKKNGVH